MTSPIKYVLFLQANGNNNGTVGSHLECYGPPSQFSSLTCVKPSFWYDNLNRLTSATEAFYQNPSAGAGYSRAFNYDEYGNMTVASNSNVPLSGLTPVSNQNPINGVNNRLQSAIYGDARGNMTQVAAGSESMSYDGESRQIQTVDSGTTISYLYDAHGQRVQKQISGGATTVDVHDAFGKLIAEYSSVGVAPTCTTCYLSYDQLGSVRLITDQSQNIIGRHDYMPYGEEIFSGSAGRSGNGFGNSANIKQMFTGQERDGGTADLDYFNARHMSAVMARFTQTDPSNAGGDIFKPQTWNGYAYVSGNPMSATDPTGMYSSAHPYGNPDYNEPSGFAGFGDPDYDFYGSHCYNCQDTSFYNGMHWPSGGGRGSAGRGSVGALNPPAAAPPATGPANPAPATAPPATGPADPAPATAPPVDPNNPPQVPHTCQQNRILNAVPGSTLTNPNDTVGTSVGGHSQFGINVTTDQLSAAGFTPFNPFGHADGYHNGNVFFQVHDNGAGGIVTQGHIDVFNPATGLFGFLGHSIVDVGIGTLLQHLLPHSHGLLDPGC